MTALPAAFLTRPIAHRGYHDVMEGRPENSRAAFEAAIEAGYGIELDLQLSSDGQAIVFHDYMLERLAESCGPIQRKTVAELSEINLKGGSEGIPTLVEVLKLVAGRVPLLIELKDQDGQMGANIGQLEAATAEALQDYTGLVALMSFNPHTVQRMTELCPDVPRGLVTSAYTPEKWAPLSPKVCAHLRDIPDYDRVGASFISHEVEDLDSVRVAELKSEGAKVLCWTVKSPESEAEARQVAENITFEQYAAQIPA